jgi:hypothetical protein
MNALTGQRRCGKHEKQEDREVATIGLSNG